MATLSVLTVKIYKKRAQRSLNAGSRTPLPLTQNTPYTSQQCPGIHQDSHVHVVSGTLQSVGHLLLKAAPLAEYSAVVGVQLVQTVLLVTQSLQTRQQITAVTTTGRSNLTQGRINAAHGRFIRIRQVAPMCSVQLHLMHVSLGPAESTPKRHLDEFSFFCSAHDRDSQTDRQTGRQTTLLCL